MKNAIRCLIVAALCFSFSITGLAVDQAHAISKEDYPSKTIEWICPFGAGGGTDTWSRTIASEAEEYFGVSLKVVNIPGASAVVGWKELLNRPADGYTIMQSSSTPVLALLSEGEKRAVDPDQIKIACFVSAFRSIMLTKKGNEWENWEDFKRYVKENPGELTIGGTLSMLMGPANVMDQLGLKVNLVPYKSTGNAITDMLGGHIDVAQASASTADTIVPEKASAILNTSELPIPSEKFKDLPNANDLGVTGMSFPRWIGVHPDTPDWVAQFVSDKMGEICKSESFKAKVEKMNEEIIYIPRSEAKKKYKNMVDTMEEKIKLFE